MSTCWLCFRAQRPAAKRRAKHIRSVQNCAPWTWTDQHVDEFVTLLFSRQPLAGLGVLRVEHRAQHARLGSVLAPWQRVHALHELAYTEQRTHGSAGIVNRVPTYLPKRCEQCFAAAGDLAELHALANTQGFSTRSWVGRGDGKPLPVEQCPPGRNDFCRRPALPPQHRRDRWDRAEDVEV